jgi:hypothetical protein
LAIIHRIGIGSRWSTSTAWPRTSAWSSGEIIDVPPRGHHHAGVVGYLAEPLATRLSLDALGCEVDLRPLAELLASSK